MDELTEDERRALRGSKFAPLPPRADQSRINHARLAHPGGPLTTNKAAALAKFLERKLKEPGSLASLDPDMVERAVRNAQAAVNPGKHYAAGSSKLNIRHVSSFSDSDEATSPNSSKKTKNKVQKLKTVKKSKMKKTKRKKKQKKKEKQKL